jgi:hypothetical protein
MYDVAAGLDRCNQGSSKTVKTADGHYWYPTNLTPIGAAMSGVTLGYLCDGGVKV